MSDGLKFTELERANLNRCNAIYHHLETWSPTDWACALGGEVGEALNLVKKLRRLEDGDKSYNVGVDRDVIIAGIGNELADVVIYADLLATRLGLSLGDCVRNKFNEVSDRVGSDIKL